MPTDNTHRPQLRDTTCTICGGICKTRFPERVPHLCRACREDHNCYTPTPEEIAAGAAEIRRKHLEEMRGKPSPRTPEPSIREVALNDCGITGVPGIGYAAGLPDWSEAESEWKAARRMKAKHKARAAEAAGGET